MLFGLLCAFIATVSISSNVVFIINTPYFNINDKWSVLYLVLQTFVSVLLIWMTVTAFELSGRKRNK
jgi:Ni/Fe-hydrogenase subunit HybB-like protein